MGTICQGHELLQEPLTCRDLQELSNRSAILLLGRCARGLYTLITVQRPKPLGEHLDSIQAGVQALENGGAQPIHWSIWRDVDRVSAIMRRVEITPAGAAAGAISHLIWVANVIMRSRLEGLDYANRAFGIVSDVYEALDVAAVQTASQFPNDLGLERPDRFAFRRLARSGMRRDLETLKGVADDSATSSTFGGPWPNPVVS